MSERHFFLQRLDLPDDADERSIRRAYARELKLIDQEADPAGFQSLREAYDIALMWSRRRPDEDDEDDEDIPPPAPATAAPAETTAPPEPAAGPASAEPPAAPAAEQPPAIDEGALGGAVFSEFLDRCQSLAGERAITDAAVWEQALRAGLADHRLISIMAREVYEYNVAALLAHGWQPGHEALLVAAIQVFQWDQDRRRVLSLGQAGHMLDAAIDQRTMFDLQSEAEQERQRKLVLRLRQPKEPSTRELVIHSATIETMIARFPEWLALIVSVPTVVHWRDLNEQVPNWRRKLTFTGGRKLSEKSAEIQGSGFNWGWLVFLFIMGVSRLASHTSHDSAADGGSPPAYSAGARDDANKLIDIGNQQLDENNTSGAIATFTRALERDPGSDMAYADRAMAHYWNDEFEQAERDSEKAERLNRSNAVVYRVRGLLAMDREQYADALAAFTRSIQLNGDNSFTYYQRGLAYEADNQNEQARADAEQAIKLHPTHTPSAYALLARLYQAKGERDKAAEQAEALIAALPDRAHSYVSAAQILARLGRNDAALAVLDRGIKASPDIMLHLKRAQLLPAADITGRRAAIQAALAMNPRAVDALLLRGQLEYDTRNYKTAVDTYTAALSDYLPGHPARVNPLMGRGASYARLGQAAAAKTDFDAATKLAGTATMLNNMCWFLATNNLDLHAALEDCEAALVKEPQHSQAFDSKGFVLLRLGRYADSVTAYDASLALRPTQAHSLYGRGVAQHRLGKHQQGDADIKAALAADEGIGKTFAAYGITP